MTTMQAATDRLDFAPPPPPGMLRAFVLAIAAHLLLMLALTWGVNWKRDTENMAAEAELWSSAAQQAAPRPVQSAVVPPTPSPPVVKPEPTPRPVPRPAPQPPVVAPEPPPAPRPADIAVAREKKKAELLERREELERERKLDAQKKLADQKKAEARAALEAQKLDTQKKQADLKRQELAAKAVQDKKKIDAAKATQAATQLREEKELSAQRENNLDRMRAQAGSGSPEATGTAQRSSGPSDSYAGRVRSKVRPNITFNDDIAGNPTAEVEVRLAPDGTITSRRIVKSSGVKSWDEAVLRALDKTDVLPRDVDGRVHTPLLIEFKPKG